MSPRWIVAAIAAGAGILYLRSKYYSLAGLTGSAPAPDPSAAATAVTQKSFEDPPRLIGANPMRVEKGQRYRMRYQAGRFDPQTSGFSDLKDYGTIYPGDWPSQFRPDPPRTDDPPSLTAYASGVWASASGSIARPDVYQIWPTMAAT